MLSDELKQKRAGRFTASSIHKLFTGGQGVTRDKYILETAVMKLTGYKKDFTSRQTEHGNYYEQEAIEHAIKHLGLNLRWVGDTFIEYDDNSGCTCDTFEYDISGEIVTHTVDLKCPASKFFDEKLEFAKCVNPEHKSKYAKYQFIPKEYYYQGQMQMYCASKQLGYEVTQHRVVRYLPDGYYDELDNYYSFNLNAKQRIFAVTIQADPIVQADIRAKIDEAVPERDAIHQILSSEMIKTTTK